MPFYCELTCEILGEPHINSIFAPQNETYYIMSRVYFLLCQYLSQNIFPVYDAQ